MTGGYILRSIAIAKLTALEVTDPFATIADAKRVLADMTAADVAPVVRCKDCQNWKRNVGLTDSPNGHCFEHDIDTNGRDFCSYGERLVTPSCEGERGMEGE